MSPHRTLPLASSRRYARTAAFFALLASAPAGGDARGQSLDGTWEISMIVANGRVLTADEIRRGYAADGRITIAGQTARLAVPYGSSSREIPLRVDWTRTPATIDVALAPGSGGHGVAMLSGNAAIICLASQERPRAASFSSTPDNGNLLLSLTRLAGGSTPAPGAPPLLPPTSYSDDQLRTMLVGTWGHQTPDMTRLITLNADGTMSAAVTWKDQFKKIFHPDVRSSGAWSVKSGVVVAQVTASTDKNARGQVYSYRIRSINDKELLAVDQDGQLRQEWKAPTP
ncbi:MAG: hypothetical protein KF847_02665 [Pirellulales bacterium]|nr:hypothetical protein [Pirellulales bacterium]